MVFNTAFAAGVEQKFPTDKIQMGVGGSSATKTFTFDVGDGATNPKLTIPVATKDFNFSKAVKIANNLLRVGDGAAVVTKVIEFDLGLGGSNPKMQYNAVSNKYEFTVGTFDVQGNLLSVGDGANTTKTLKFNKGANSPEIRYNAGNGKLEFSNDAIVYKAIGSGTGGGDGGINLIDNSSFEDGVTAGWSNVGGTFTSQNYTNPSPNDLKFARFVATASGQYFETALITVPDNFGVGCMSDLKYNQTGASFKMSALDSSGNVLATQNLTTVTGWSKASVIAWQCPAAGQTMRFRFESLAAGTVDVDSVHFGSNKGLTASSLTKVAAKVRWTGASNTYTHDTDNKLTFSGASWSTPSGDLTWNSGSQRLIANRAGSYPITFAYRASLGVDASIQRQHMAKLYVNGSLVDRAGYVHGLSSNNVNSGGAGGAMPDAQITTVLDLAVNDYIEFYAYGSNGAGNSYTISDARVDVFKLPNAVEGGVTNDQSSWMIEASVGGANPTTGTAAVTSYTEITNPGLSLVTSAFSAPVGIACASGGTSVVGNTTCSGSDESLGITFNPPYAGYFDVCTKLTPWAQGSAQIMFTFRLDRVPNSGAISTLTAGTQEIPAGGSAGTQDWGGNAQVCSTVYFGDTAQKTMKAMRVQTATASGSGIYADRAGTNVGQRAVYFTVRPALQNMARPVLTGDQVTSKGYTDGKICSFYTSDGAGSETPCSSASCTTQKIKGGCANISSVSRSSVGRYTYTFVPGYWSDPSNVTCLIGNGAGGAGRLWGFLGSSFSTTVRTINFDNASNAATDNSWETICYGK